jgi:predicted nucleotidyltransferase
MYGKQKLSQFDKLLSQKKIREQLTESIALPKFNRKLFSTIMGNDKDIEKVWFALYKQAVSEGSQIPTEVAWIRFRELYSINVFSGKWEAVMNPVVEIGTSSSGNHGHSGRPHEVGGSGGDGNNGEFKRYVVDLRKNISKEFGSIKSQAQAVADQAGLKIKIVKVALSGSYGRVGGKQPTEDSDVDIKYTYKGHADIQKVADVLAGTVNGSYGTYDAHAERIGE